MESIVRAVVIFFGLHILLRITGNRSLAQITVFDFVLLLIISEAAQNGLIGNDYSITNSLVTITTLVVLDIGLSLLKQHSSSADRLLDGLPVLLVDNGKLLKDRMDKERVDEEDILESARELQGLERLDQIKYAVLERDGQISIIPRRQEP